MVKKEAQASQFGMFSKAGRYTNEKYIIFQKKDQIMQSNQQQKQIPQKQKFAQNIKKNENPNDIFQYANNIVKTVNQEKPKLEIKNQDCPFTRQSSRDYAQKIKQIKNPPPPTGHYHPKFSEIDFKIHHSNLFYNKTYQKSRKNQEQLGDFEIEMKVIPDKLEKKLLGQMKMRNQTARPNNYCPINPHDKRFEIIKDSYHNSDNPRPNDVLMQKCLGRYDYLHAKKQKNAPDYNSNYEFGKKKIVLQVPDFQRTTARNFKEKQSICSNENFFNYDQFKQREQTQVFKRVSSVKINRQLPKYSNENDVFPSFMQKTMTGRQDLAKINQKMLEVNNFATARFQSNTSSFPIKQTVRPSSDLEFTQQNSLDFVD